MYASYAGERIVSGTVEIPTTGRWTADLFLAEDKVIPSTGPLTIGNLTMQGFTYRDGPYAGQRRVRAAGGAGGWHKVIPEQDYDLSGGVLLSVVLRDAAMAVGEQVNVLSDGPVGVRYVRQSGPASRVLRQLVGDDWYVDPAGTTQVHNPRPTTRITSQFLVNDADLGLGLAEVSTENPSDWMPGRTFTSPTITQLRSINTVRHTLGDTLRTQVLFSGVGPDRFIGALHQLVEETVPDEPFFGLYEYTVQATDGTTIDGSPTETTLGLPNIRGVTIRTGLAGGAVTPALGSLCYVAFANGEPTRPIVHSFDSTTSQHTSLNSGSEGAARIGDTVNAGYLVLTSIMTVSAYFPGTPAGLIAATAAAAALIPPGTVLGLTGGRITPRSSTVGRG